jgi:predicted nucleic acid-binding protein
MCKITDDKWFFDNGYFKKSREDAGVFLYDITNETEKWRKLFDTCIAITPRGQIITQEILFKTIKEGNTVRKKKQMCYIKLTPEEKLRRVKEKQRVKELNIKIRKHKEKNADRNVK